MLVAAVLAVPIVVVGLGFQDGADLLWNDDKIVAGIVPLRVLTEFFRRRGGGVAGQAARFGRAAALVLEADGDPGGDRAALYVVQLWDPARRLRFGRTGGSTATSIGAPRKPSWWCRCSCC
ncbi:hypothetical protein [Amycolatopsis australiensis]|uniref:hypothetical protein n=1 Tax=Amycolatopsis australiensis TaxID=546364 RepID=UPI001FE5F886|nr:hypothetical protein [Amycolatopsis australiensis]